MRAIVTGQIGIDKKPYLQAVAERAGERGNALPLFNVGNMMYTEGPDIRGAPRWTRLPRPRSGRTRS